jgi:hypothetical protein
MLEADHPENPSQAMLCSNLPHLRVVVINGDIVISPVLVLFTLGK